MLVEAVVGAISPLDLPGMVDDFASRKCADAVENRYHSSATSVGARDQYTYRNHKGSGTWPRQVIGHFHDYSRDL